MHKHKKKPHQPITHHPQHRNAYPRHSFSPSCVRYRLFLFWHLHCTAWSVFFLAFFSRLCSMVCFFFCSSHFHRRPHITRRQHGKANTAKHSLAWHTFTNTSRHGHLSSSGDTGIVYYTPSSSSPSNKAAFFSNEQMDLGHGVSSSILPTNPDRKVNGKCFLFFL